MALGITGAEVLPKIYREFGQKKLVFDVAKMTPAIQGVVKQKVADIKAESSLYARVEMNQDETHSAYLERASVDNPEYQRKFDESPIEHAKRVMRPTGMDSGEYAFKVLNALSEVFNQPKLEWEEVQDVPLWELRLLCYNILNFCDCPLVTDFAPKRLVNSSQLK